jgi:hypothetical protein
MSKASKHLEAEVEINSASETITENIKISAKESLGYYELNKRQSSGVENREYGRRGSSR